MSVNWVQRIPGSAWLFSLAAIASLLSLIVIVDVIEGPFEHLFTSLGVSSIFTGFVSIAFTAGYIGLFVLMLLESMSLPIPSEVFLPLAGYFIYLGRMTFPVALAVSTAAGLLGSLAAYYLALALGPPIVYALANRIGVSQGSLAKSETWLSGRGSIMILIARFIPGLRSSISFPAGVLKMNLARFSIMTLIGSFGWSALLIYLGYSAGALWQGESGVVSNVMFQALPYVVALLSILYMIHFVWKRIPSIRKVGRRLLIQSVRG